MPNLTFNQELKDHSRDFERQVHQIGDNVYSAVGYSMANSIMIEGTDGIIIVDTLDCVEAGKLALAEFRKITDKPIKAVVYTHNHQDHILGVGAYVRQEDVGRTVDIYSHERLLGNAIKSNLLLGPITIARAMYMYGRYLERDDEGYLNDGLGPDSLLGKPSFIAPNRTFADTLDVEIAGVKLHMLYVPSETDDEIAVYLPDQQLMLTAETINPTFPNCYTIRGTPYRDVHQWYRSIDRMRRYPIAAMVPSHGNPVSGKEHVAATMTAYRDMIQYVHDQAVQLMNRGCTADELAEMIQLPAHLSSIHPYGREFYGTVKHVVRNIYDGYLGWFNADPATLDPLPPLERARAYVELGGGKDAYLRRLREVVDAGDYRWAAEMATWLIRAEPDLQDAKSLKAHALRQLGYATINASWRNFYLSGALELERRLDERSAINPVPPADALKTLPLASLIEVLSVWLDAEATADVELTLAFKFTDVQENYGLQIRRGVAEFWDTLPDEYDFAIVTTREVVDQLLLGDLKPLRAVAEGKIQIEGDAELLDRVLRYFVPGRLVSQVESVAGLIGLRHAVGYFLHPSQDRPQLVDR